jgi:hypothetical protein
LTGADPRTWFAALLIAALCACATTSNQTLVPANDRPFDFARDTFAFVNELQWQYRRDPETGRMSYDGPNRDAQYVTRCFALARSARQFYQFARFDPAAPRVDEDGYRRRIREVIDRDPSQTGAAERVVVPGYASLRDFSRDWEGLLKEELGGWRDSYLQRGNWRMVLPFRRDEREASAAELLQEIAVDRPPVVHVSDFPVLDINHAMMLYAAVETPDEIQFTVYDPNNSAQPSRLRFVRADGHFYFERTHYYGGGTVDVYEIYRSLLY